MKNIRRANGAVVSPEIRGWVAKKVLKGKVPISIGGLFQVSVLEEYEDRKTGDPSQMHYSAKHCKTIMTPMNRIWDQCTIQTPLSGYTIVDIIQLVHRT